MPTLTTMMQNSAMLSNVSAKYLTPPNFYPPEDNPQLNKTILAGQPFNTMDQLLKNDFGAQPSLSTLLENYNDSKGRFGLELKENLDSLKDASDRLQDLKDDKEAEREENATGVFEELAIDDDSDENTGSALSNLKAFAEGEIPPELKNLANIPIAGQNEENPNAKNELPEKQNNLQDFANKYLTAENPNKTPNNFGTLPEEDSRIGGVRNLVQNYNNAVNYLNENRGVSNLMSALADKFVNNQTLNESLNEIGISIDAQGFLVLNENIFNQALNKDADEVETILGSEGLAGQLEKNIDLANYQGDKLFTSIIDFANQNKQDDAESLYGNKANYAKENSPRFVTMFS